MAARDAHTLAFGPVQFRDRFGQAHADAKALKVGQRHESRDATVVLAAHDGERGAEGNRKRR
jgi:hypothetical protein